MNRGYSTQIISDNYVSYTGLHPGFWISGANWKIKGAKSSELWGAKLCPQCSPDVETNLVDNQNFVEVWFH